MSTSHKNLISPEEYLALERKAETKSEFYAGEIFALAGASLRHNLIAGNVLIGQDTSRVELYRKQMDGTWIFSETTDARSTVRLTLIDCRLTLSAIYDKVDF
ncbi:MAG: Uma2 family endonuclease [Acidobacteriota bacterium]|nr:Uma2 family endonuclease [Acidobacteriota bacterium]